jgi:AraC family transcriptional regulator
MNTRVDQARARLLQPVDCFADFYRTSDYSAFPQEHRASPLHRIKAFIVDQQPHELVDAACSGWILGLPLRASCQTQFDFGDGWQRMRRGRGDMLLVPPGTEVRYRIAGPTRLLVVSFANDNLVNLDPELFGDPASRLQEATGRYFRNVQVETICRNLWSDLAKGDAAAPLLLQGAMVSLAGSLLRFSSGGGAKRSRNRADIRRSVAYIQDNLRNEMRLSDIAQVAGLSVFHFSREFRLQTGHSPYRFIQVKRAAAAAHMLTGSRAEVETVARACGFNSVRRMREAIRRFPCGTE